MARMLCAIPWVCLGEIQARETIPPVLNSPPPLDLPSPPAFPMSPFDLPSPPAIPMSTLDLSSPPSTDLLPNTSSSRQREANSIFDPSDDPIIRELNETESVDSQADFSFGYDLRQSNTSWLVGDGDDLGIFSLESFPTLSIDDTSGIVTGMGFHFLGGPIRTDMPPRLFDFQIGFQRREWTSAEFGYDVSMRVGVFSDFEGSARKGVRFPGHAVGYYRCNRRLDIVLGIDYLDRDDISLLPVAGVIITPWDELRLELVFPRPRLELRIKPKQSLYLGGELGGGTWAIERTSMTNDVVTYRDLRLLLGVSRRHDDGEESGLEIGYVFSRDLSYRSGMGDFAPDDTLLLRATRHY